LRWSFPVLTSRPAWNGYLKLSFVSCPIALYPATAASDRLSFRQVNRRTGHPLKHKLVDSVTGEEVASSDKARGYETDTDKFLLVEDRDIERARSNRPAPGAVELTAPSSFRRDSPPTAPYELQEDEGAGDEGKAEEIVPTPRPRNTRTVEIERFVPVGQVEVSYFEKPYYIAPRGEIGQEAFAVVRDAMAREKVAGLARIVLASRERPFLIEPMGRGLRGITLRFTQDLRPEQDFFAGIPSMRLPAEMMELARHIIRTKSAEFDAAMLEDRYRTALVRILRKKQAKRAAAAPAASPSRENVINLMDALRRSIAAQDKPKRRGTGRKRRTPESASTRRGTG
jgi:DNA end-binding protein Ku